MSEIIGILWQSDLVGIYKSYKITLSEVKGKSSSCWGFVIENLKKQGADRFVSFQSDLPTINAAKGAAENCTESL